MIVDAKFIFIICQIGAETAIKRELAREWPEFRFAFSRPGFLTFKLPAGLRLAADFELRSVFARTYGFSLGKVTGNDAQSLAQQTWQLAGDVDPSHVHVWQRDLAVPGEREFEPGPTPLADEVGRLIGESRPAPQANPRDRELVPINQVAEPGALVLDCVLVEPNEWWLGFHQAESIALRWPGGVPPLDRTTDFVSRAYLKTQEAILWSRLPLKAGDIAVEIGSAPGGASQALLEHGLSVIGVDPAEMDPDILEHPQFTHVRKRADDMKRREFRDVKWLFVDANVAPQQTLDTVEAIVTHREVHIRGVVLTLKLSEWKFADQVPEFIERVRKWGYESVSARQLAFNRQEICVVARHR